MYFPHNLSFEICFCPKSNPLNKYVLFLIFLLRFGLRRIMMRIGNFLNISGYTLGGFLL